MQKLHKRLAEWLFNYEYSERLGDQCKALFEKAKVDAAHGDERAAEALRSLDAIACMLLDEMKPMPPEVGQAIKDTWEGFGEDATMGPRECEAIWAAALEGGKK